jgi:(S)-3,5-dihydroxyphenylglycine transaminase
MRLPVPVDLTALERCATTFGVLWTPMAPFHLDGRGRNEIRLSCSYLDPPRIDEGVRRLTEFLSDTTNGGRPCGS